MANPKIVDDDTALFSGDSWNGVDVYGKPVIVTFSFPTTAPGYDASAPGFDDNTVGTFKAFDADEQIQALSALGEWAKASGIVFVEVAPGQGDINFQNIDLSKTAGYNGDSAGIGFYPFGNWTYSSLPSFSSDLSASGDVFMNTQDQDDNGTVNYGTLLHEIGHAIGLKHPTEIDDDILGVSHDEELASNDPTKTIMATVGDPSDEHLKALDKQAVADLYGATGGAVITASATGTNSVASWSWDATTQTLTQTAVGPNETIHGTSVDDIIHAVSGNNNLFGLAGNNKLYAGSGDDNLYDGPGQNLLVGGAGNDSFYVSNAATVIQVSSSTGNDTLYATVSYKLPQNVNTLYLYGPGLTGTGNSGNDTIFGDVSGSTLIAGSGDDYIAGGAGNDKIYAGAGHDTLFGGGGNDTFVFQSAADASTSGTLTYIGDFISGQDKIDLSGITTTGADPGQPLSFNIGLTSFTGIAGQVIETHNGTQTLLEGDLSGDRTADFEIAVYSTSGVAPTVLASDLVLTQAACYCRGARISTERGEICIEDLAIGDRVVTASGELRPIVWIGHRRIDIARHNQPDEVKPIRVHAGAFGPAAPRRDLWLSRHHCVAFEGSLIPIGLLINDLSVEAVDADSVEYWHVELDAHDLVLAEGLAAESYLDCGNRNAFANGGAFIEAHPDFKPKHWSQTCLPHVSQGPVVARARARLLERLAQSGYVLDHEPQAQILVDGLAFAPLRLSEARLAFVLPPGGRDIVLRSNTFVPAHTMAASADVRSLGLCIGRLQIDGVEVSLDDEATCAQGWHRAEVLDGTFAHRWTSGTTPLPAGARVVLIDLAGVGGYWRRREARKPSRSA